MISWVSVMARAVMAQLEGSGRGGLASYNATGYKDLEDSLESLIVMDTRQWISELMLKNNMIGMVTWHHLQFVASLFILCLPSLSQPLRMRIFFCGPFGRIHDHN